MEKKNMYSFAQLTTQIDYFMLNVLLIAENNS